jgi:hypothetical protein
VLKIPAFGNTQNVLEKLRSKAFGKRRNCIYHNCTNTAINSHLLQKNGILSKISEQGHVYELTSNRYSDKLIDKHYFKKVGVNKTISSKLFCNHHDSKLFSRIEIGKIDYSSYQSQILLAYRAVASELRLKEIIKDYLFDVYSNTALDFYIDKVPVYLLRESVQLGIKDMSFYKSKLENELKQVDTDGFEFFMFDFPRIDICASSCFSPISQENSLDQIQPLQIVFFSIFPDQNVTRVILGYYREIQTEWMSKFIDSFRNISTREFEYMISNILATRIESFCISPALLNSIEESKLKYFLSYWNVNSDNMSELQEFNLNLFGK